ncbi:MAG: hypothetical protein KDB03_19290 [Planctomycetales bacterium]|nr:hypothetical protein [Planctomycetales bacterium]
MSEHSATCEIEERTRWLICYGHELLGDKKSVSMLQNLAAWQREILNLQLKLRSRCTKRFPDPEHWLWTQQSYEQASDWWSAQFKASLFPPRQQIFDVCCGAGADSVALAKRGSVVAVDQDAIITMYASHNMKSHGVLGEVRQGRYRAQECVGGLVHIDPDRRSDGKRRGSASSSYSPPLEDILPLGQSAQGSMIKLSPMCVWHATNAEFIRRNFQRLWLGNFHECRQQLLISGDLRCNQFGEKTAVLCDPEKTSTFTSCVQSNVQCQIVNEPGKLRGKFLYDLHPVLHASQLTSDFAIQHDLNAVHSPHGYFVADRTLTSAWLQTFQVLEILPFDNRKIRSWLRLHGAGMVEVKSRLFSLDASKLQRQLGQSSGNSVTLLVTRIGEKIRAVAAQRLCHKQIASFS